MHSRKIFLRSEVSVEKKFDIVVRERNPKTRSYKEIGESTDGTGDPLYGL